MPLFVPEMVDDTLVNIDRLKDTRLRLHQLINEGEGCDANSLKNCITLIRESFADAHTNYFWSGYAARSCHEQLEKVVRVLEASVEEYASILKELDTYIEVYEYVDAAAKAIADGAAEAVQQTTGG